jgi:hypothetical protein
MAYSGVEVGSENPCKNRRQAHETGAAGYFYGLSHRTGHEMQITRAISCSGVKRSGAFASDNHVLRASLRVVDIIAYVENFLPAPLNIEF